MMKNRLTPLEELRQEKELVRLECKEGEERLSEHWAYLSDNAGSLIFQSTINSVLSVFGFGGSSKSKKRQKETSTSSGLLSGLTAYYPVIWEIVQPIIWRFVIKKLKSIFSGKKKKEKDKDND